jgi:hypothetical protein
MSLNITNLNGDTSFLLTFTPAPTHQMPLSPTASSSYTILLDPWLTGTSKIWHPKFFIASHSVKPAISSLRDLPTPPDLVIISQNKDDHCHFSTLRELSPTCTKTTILAPADAIKTIRRWKHFTDTPLAVLPRWNAARSSKTVLRFPIPPLTPTGEPGEVTVTYIAPRYDMTGLHNAIGITYRPPAAAMLLEVNIPADTHNGTGAFPLTPPASPHGSGTATPGSTLLSQTVHHMPGTPSNALSVLYSPHGLGYSHIRSYAEQHLVATAALPLTALLHCLDQADNPWWLGGNICAGMLGGVEIARNLLARLWVSAHDEEKVGKGCAAKWLGIKKFEIEEIRRMLADGQDEKGKGGREETRVEVLEVGESFVMGA